MQREKNLIKEAQKEGKEYPTRIHFKDPLVKRIKSLFDEENYAEVVSVFIQAIREGK